MISTRPFLSIAFKICYDQAIKQVIIIGGKVIAIDIADLVKEINQTLKEPDFEKRKPALSAAASRLEKIIKDDPRHVRAVCVLAMVLYELRYDEEVCLAFLADCYRRYAGQFTDEELTVLETDMAFFHIGGWYCYDEEGIDLLVSAAARGCKFQQTYYALGWVFFHEQEYEDAASQFAKAYDICGDKRLLYNEAVSLYYSGRIDKSIAMLEKILPGQYHSEVDFRSGVFYATLLAMGDDREKARVFLDGFLQYCPSEDVEAPELAEIMFLLRDYPACAAFYEREDYYEEASWLDRYFYALKQMGSDEKAYRKLKACREAIRLDIKEAEDTAEDFDSPEDVIDYIESQLVRQSEIEKGYHRIFTSNEKPLLDYQPGILERCYYIYCPRHYEED